MCKCPVAGKALGRNNRAEEGEGDREGGAESDRTALLATRRSLNLTLHQGEATEGARKGVLSGVSHSAVSDSL